MINYVSYVIGGIVLIFLLGGIRIVRPMERAAIERLGRYRKFAREGFNWIIPVIDRMVKQEIAEQMMDIESFEAITKERLNTQIDLVVYYKVMEDEKSVFKSLYKVANFEKQITRLAQTTARNVIGEMNFEIVNSQRNLLNKRLKETIEKQSDAWGVEIVRVETKEITPPKEVQESMNEVLMAENKKTAAVNLAMATETQADGMRRANIKEAQGIAQGKKIVAEANAYKIKVENDAAKKYFVGNAQKLKKLEVTQASLENNSKVVLTENGINPNIILGKLPFEKD